MPQDGLAGGVLGGVAGASAAAPLPNLRETSMLYTWVQHRLGLYLEQLRKHLPHITEGGNLASVIEHCMVRARSPAVPEAGLPRSPCLRASSVCRSASGQPIARVADWRYCPLRYILLAVLRLVPQSRGPRLPGAAAAAV